MEGVGTRLRKRARELDLPDAEVARRAGLGTQRYGHYVAGRREPDLATFLRICRVLDVTPNDVLLGPMKNVGRSTSDKLHARLSAAVSLLKPDDLPLAIDLIEALARHRSEQRRAR